MHYLEKQGFARTGRLLSDEKTEDLDHSCQLLYVCMVHTLTELVVFHVGATGGCYAFPINASSL